MSEVILETRGLGFKRKDKWILKDFSTSIMQGELVSLLGPSGCGKTTLLRLLAGLEKPNEGEILLRGKKVADDENSEAAHKRNIGFVFQNFALFERVSVKSNIFYGCKSKDHHEHAQELIEMMRLKDHLNKKPTQLSGGERQRVALARSLAVRPDVIFLDEPFASIDESQTEFLIEEIKSLFKQLSVTALMVTHSKFESQLFCTRSLQFS